jgi:hypothetical protein
VIAELEKDDAVSSPVYAVREGDIFTIPIDDRHVYVGHVICEYLHAWFVVVFDECRTASEARANPTHALASRPLFGAIVFDARFRPGMWELIGHSDSQPDRFAPAYSMEDPRAGGMKILNFRGTKMRAAAPEEAEIFPRRTYNSPLVLEKAVRAHAGRERWLPAFDDFLVANQPKSVDVFETL